MRSPRGLVASSALLLALPLAVLYQDLAGSGGEAVIHGLLALGTALLALAVIDFKTPRWATWVGTLSAGVLAAIFFLQGMSEVTHDEALHYLAYQVMGQRLEVWLVNPILAWCVVVLVVDPQLTWRKLGILAMATVACVQAYSLGLSYRGTSLDVEAPILKTLWLMPSVWILFESTTGKRRPSATR